MYGFEVASFTDAWIETNPYRIIQLCKDVASFTDAWIETEKGRQAATPTRVASFTDAWIETLTYIIQNIIIESHLLQMRGLKHLLC